MMVTPPENVYEMLLDRTRRGQLHVDHDTSTVLCWHRSDAHGVVCRDQQDLDELEAFFGFTI